MNSLVIESETLSVLESEGVIVFCCGVPEPHIQIKQVRATGKIDNI